METTERKPPVLGTPESAALAFVNIMAAATEIREEQLAYWLDAYYQLRRAYERDAEIETAWDDTILCKSNLEPIMRQLWQETLKKSSTKAAEQRLAEKAAAIAAPAAEPEAKAEAPVNPNKAAAAFKQATRARLLDARRQGLGAAKLAELSDGALSKEEILDILEGKKQPVETYRGLAAALDRWAIRAALDNRPEPDNSSEPANT